MMHTGTTHKQFSKELRACLAAFVLLGGALALSLVLYLDYERAATPSPLGESDSSFLNLAYEETEASTSETSASDVCVDWNYWQDINPDIIGWIIIEDTSVSQPIVQAPKDNPDYYLTHNIYGNRSAHGAIYLDADCADDGLFSRNAVILGHHMNDGSMFAAIASYTDYSWALQHHSIRIILPDGQTQSLEVRYTSLADASIASKRTSFADDDAFSLWYVTQKETAACVLDDITIPERVTSLVTCSSQGRAWRTCVVAS